MLPNEVNNAPAALALLNMRERERRYFGPPQAATQKNGEDRTIAFSVLPDLVKPGDYRITAVAEYQGRNYEEGYRLVGYAGVRIFCAKLTGSFIWSTHSPSALNFHSGTGALASFTLSMERLCG